MHKQISILSTRPIDSAIVAEAASLNVVINQHSFIETKPLLSDATVEEIREIATQPKIVVFTSMNAVDVVASIVGNEVAWKIYAIGYATKHLIESYWGAEQLIGTAENATSLAYTIVDDKPSESIVFFCGKQRREELPQILRNHHFLLREVVVYETFAIKQSVHQAYDGILFFSPSAVDSFFASNTVPRHTILFAIGSTTATAIQQYSNNTVVISNQPGKHHLIQTMLQFYATN